VTTFKTTELGAEVAVEQAPLVHVPWVCPVCALSFDTEPEFAEHAEKHVAETEGATDIESAAEIVHGDDQDGPVSPSELITALRQAIMPLLDDVEQLAAAEDWDRLVAGIVALDRIRADLADVRAVAEEHVGRHLAALPRGKRRLVVDGVGVAEVSKRRERTEWDWSGLLAEIVRAARVDPDTGEVLVSDADALARRLLPLLPLTPSTGARVTSLRDAGIDVDEFRDTEWGDRWVVRVLYSDS